MNFRVNGIVGNTKLMQLPYVTPLIVNICTKSMVNYVQSVCEIRPSVLELEGRIGRMDDQTDGWTDQTCTRYDEFCIWAFWGPVTLIYIINWRTVFGTRKLYATFSCRGYRGGNVSLKVTKCTCTFKDLVLTVRNIISRYLCRGIESTWSWLLTFLFQCNTAKYTQCPKKGRIILGITLTNVDTVS